jgi:hypothetical protein
MIHGAAEKKKAREEAIARIKTRRLTAMRYHATQHALWTSSVRFPVIPAGRRSGKTELGKRKLVQRAINHHRGDHGLYVASAPTFRQAKRIYWKDLKALVPNQLKRGKPSETELVIPIRTPVGLDAEIMIAGMDAPDRIEGFPIDGILLDEYGNMKRTVWTENVRPGLSTPGRPGWAWLFGVPEGRNHYFHTYEKACLPTTNGWAGFHWPSADILDPEEVAAAKADLDPVTFDQEYNANFVNFQGRAYYEFTSAVHAVEKLEYQPQLPLIFAFDFNETPGVAAILQEQKYEGENPLVGDKDTRVFTACIDEVWIKNSKTPKVCRELINKYSHHEGIIYIYGDSTGGSGGSAKVQGSDWDLVKHTLTPQFGNKLRFYYPSANPHERSRVNAMNSRIQSSDGRIRFMVDPQKCMKIIVDFEGVSVIDDGSGRLDKKSDKMLTHVSDAVGYYVFEKFVRRSGNFVRRLI